MERPGGGPGRWTEGERQEGLLETCVSVAIRPAPTLRRVTAQAPVAWAVVVIAVLGAATGFAEGAAPGPWQFGGPAERAIGAGALIFGTIFGAVGALIFAVIWSGILHIVSKVLGGTGAYAGMFSGVAFAGVPNFIGVPVTLLTIPLGPGGAALSGLVQFGLFIWVLVLTVIAIRENNGFTTARAVATLLTPLAVLLVIGMFFIALFAIAAISIGRTGGAPTPFF